MGVTLKGVLGVIALIAVVILLNPKPDHAQASVPAVSLTQSAVFKNSEIGCDRPIWSVNNKARTNGKALGFFVKIRDGKAEFYARDDRETLNGHMRFSGKLTKEGRFYFVEGKDGESLQFEITSNETVTAIWNPDSSYHISQINCTIAAK